MAAAKSIEANKFDNDNLFNLKKDTDRRADAFLFNDDHHDRAGFMGRPDSGARKRASSPDIGGVSNPFSDNMNRPKTVK